MQQHKPQSIRVAHALAATALAALVPAFSAQAATVAYDNGTYVGGANAIGTSTTAVADDFSINTALTFDGLRLWMADTPAGLLPNFSGTMSWFIYAGSAGSPAPNAIPSSTVVAQGTATVAASQVTVSNTGALLVGNEIAQIDISIPAQTLQAGTYWLRIKEGAPGDGSDGSTIFWVFSGSALKGNGYRADSSVTNPTTWSVAGLNTTTDLSFQLTSSISADVPEPGSLALVGLGAGLMAMRRRRVGG